MAHLFIVFCLFGQPPADKWKSHWAARPTERQPLPSVEQRDWPSTRIDYFILGTRAIMDLDWLETVVSRFPGRIFVGVDARENDIYVNGWTENSGITIDDYLKKIEPLDIAGIIYTDINKDGMNQGPNFENTQRINGLTRHAVIASGGVRSKDDLDRLETMGITQAIVGKASHSDEFWRDIR